MDKLAPYTGVFATVGIAIVLVLVARKAAQAYRDAAHYDRQQALTADRMLQGVLERVGPRSEEAARQLKQRLIMAGMREDGAVTRFTMWRVGALVGAIGLFVLLTLSMDAVNPRRLIMYGIALGSAGLFLPNVMLDRIIRERQARISRALPAVIDLMVLCLDVGLSVEQAFDRVTAEMTTVEPLMAEEASIMTSEINAGLTFPQALRRMAERIGLEELMTIARLVGQANTLGASIAHALREYSEASFTRRMLGLEERAGKVSAKLMLPTTVCLLPSALMAMMGPAVIMIIRSLKNM